MGGRTKMKREIRKRKAKIILNLILKRIKEAIIKAEQGDLNPAYIVALKTGLLLDIEEGLIHGNEEEKE